MRSRDARVCALKGPRFGCSQSMICAAITALKSFKKKRVRLKTGTLTPSRPPGGVVPNKARCPQTNIRSLIVNKHSSLTRLLRSLSLSPARALSLTHRVSFRRCRRRGEVNSSPPFPPPLPIPRSQFDKVSLLLSVIQFTAGIQSQKGATKSGTSS